MRNKLVSKNNIEPIKVLDGVYRRTLSYSNNLMLCHFFLKKGSEIPIHSHKQHQIGYIIRGKLNFFTENDNFIAKKGDSYLFNSNEKHGAIILEDSEVIDVFNPSRDDYK
ncbi:MAG: cupin domain-containing protein [Candidatus Odinarchaeota archaeon]